MMSSNLPLLFMDGYPTTLERMSIEKLEKFITFMVRCSLGHDTAKEIKVPLWWPREVPFTNPFKRAKNFRCADWKELLLNLITKCYRYHRMEDMIGFSVQLAEISKDNFRILDNWNGTTSFFEKSTSKLLVTVRNELLTYDRRKYQLRNKFHRRVETIILEPEVDTFICQNCCEAFTTFKALKGHERTCSSVILIDLDDPLYDHGNNDSNYDIVSDTHDTISVSPPPSPSSSITRTSRTSGQSPGPGTEISSHQHQVTETFQETFLQTFNLCSHEKLPRFNEDRERDRSKKSISPPPCNNRRQLLSLTKCPNIPFSSNIGQILLKRTRKELTSDNIHERCGRIERFTRTSPVKKLYPSQNPQRRPTTYPVTYRQPKGAHKKVQSTRPYNFRGRRSRLHGLSERSQIIYRMYCSRICVEVKQLTDLDITNINTKLKGNYPLDELVNETNLIPPPSPLIVRDDIIEISDSEDEQFEEQEYQVTMVENTSDSSDDEIEFVEEPTIVIVPSDIESENQDPLEELYGKTDHGFGAAFTDPKRRLFGTIQQFSDEVPGVVCVD
ncbi:uncharacterized protein LOC123302632 [Chrysoperla carnea]|uniref:uncharacterized protein LOC123302632 n=1 Tax=Chrysoperla carnea TaxID=189513 RepID=UPI001D0971E9|nr:uncharacterized protein LOC123302632 [Chrysoperla carnea]